VKNKGIKLKKVMINNVNGCLLMSGTAFIVAIM
jgi:hypothetical protein